LIADDSDVGVYTSGNTGTLLNASTLEAEGIAAPGPWADVPGQMTPPSSARDDRHRAQAQFSARGLPTKGTHDGQS
jgi:hypothetical protein